MTSDLQLPPGFIFGAATAAYQIEGAANEDGRGESIWDRFSATPGKVRNGETGAIACDFYHRYADDIRLMQELGLRAFRFSIAWPRILPDGIGTVNQRGLDFYDRMVDELLARGIQPFATLYHWDLPQRIEDRGGWTSRETVDAFVEYVDVVTRRLGDRVGHWITHNEPWVAAWVGYGWGSHAPGRSSERDAIAATHHLMLSHGKAVDVIRRNAPQAAAGITLNLSAVYPATESEADTEAARLMDLHHNRWFLDPIFRGSYPADGGAFLDQVQAYVRPGDLEQISVPLDFLGINNYTRSVVVLDAASGQPRGVHQDGSEYTEMDWEVAPEGIHDLLVRVHEDYGPPMMYVTENGAAFPDVRVHDGSVRDPERIAYLEAYIAACARAIEEGVPLAGYFVWSFLDNFEWGHGYSRRFGIVYIDYPTLERIPKSSYHWYRKLIENQVGAATAAV